MKMTVGELIRTLQDMNEESEIRIAVQPSYPMSYAIDSVEEVMEEGGVVTYITEGGDGRYAKREIFG